MTNPAAALVADMYRDTVLRKIAGLDSDQLREAVDGRTG